MIIYNTHLKYGWGKDSFNVDNPIEKYWIHYDKAKYVPCNFKEEFKKAILLATDLSKKSIVVHASGGIDSEVVCLTLNELDLPYTISILEIDYKNNKNCNEHENRYIYKFIKKHDIPYKVNRIDLEHYVKNTLLEEAHKYKTYRLGMLLHSELIKFFPDSLNLYGDGRFSLSRYRDVNIEQDGLILIDDIGTMHTHFKARELGIHSVRRLFMFTPELMLSYILDKDVAHWIKYADSFFTRDAKFGNINCEQIKRFMTFRHWPELENRPKYTGLENVEFLRNKDPKDYCYQIFLEINRLYNGRDNLIYKATTYQNLLDLLTP
jgi:hypothetical protein